VLSITYLRKNEFGRTFLKTSLNRTRLMNIILSAYDITAIYMYIFIMNIIVANCGRQKKLFGLLTIDDIMIYSFRLQ